MTEIGPVSYIPCFYNQNMIKFNICIHLISIIFNQKSFITNMWYIVFKVTTSCFQNMALPSNGPRFPLYCMCIHCHREVFTMPMPNNDHLFLLHYSGLTIRVTILLFFVCMVRNHNCGYCGSNPFLSHA